MQVLVMEYPLKKIRFPYLILVIMTGLFSYGNTYSQCTGGSKIGDITPTIPWQTWPCVTGGSYLEFVATGGNTYIFNFCMGGGAASWDTELTILDSAGNTIGPISYNDDACFLASYLSWSCPSSGRYRILTTQYPCTTNTQCGVLAYKCEPLPGGPGVDCGNPHVIPSLPFSQGGLNTSGFLNDYNSTHACNSTYMDGEDYVFSYNGTAGECISVFTQNTFTYSGLFLLDGCPDDSMTTCIASVEAGGGNPFISNATLPTNGTYYIVVSGASNVPFMPFDISITNCVAVGVGNTCANAFPIPSLPYTQQGFTTCGFGDDYDNADACGSPFMDGEDFVFKYTSPGNECIRIDLENTDLYTGFFVFDGCPDLAATNCIAQRTEISGNPLIRRIDLVNPGDYYIVVGTQPNPDCTPFDFEILHCPPLCNLNPNGSDLCSNATPVTLGPSDTICGFTDENYTANASTDLTSEFCGTIENNTWFSFQADSTTMTFVAEAGNCISGFGIQAEIFETSDCINFNSVSDCWNPMLATAGTFQATNLTVGNTYLLMLDGYAGDDCEFIMYRLQGPLPVEYGPFSAIARGEDVYLNWETYREENSRGFILERGQLDGRGEEDHIQWEEITFIDGHGDTEGGHVYSHVDQVEFNGEAFYYRLRQIDWDGHSTYSEIRRVELEGPGQSQLMALYPNPTQNEVNIQYFAQQNEATLFRLIDLQGKIVFEQSFGVAEEGVYDQKVMLGALSRGLYLYQMQVGSASFSGKLNLIP